MQDLNGAFIVKLVSKICLKSEYLLFNSLMVHITKVYIIYIFTYNNYIDLNLKI